VYGCTCTHICASRIGRTDVCARACAVQRRTRYSVRSTHTHPIRDACAYFVRCRGSARTASTTHTHTSVTTRCTRCYETEVWVWVVDAVRAQSRSPPPSAYAHIRLVATSETSGDGCVRMRMVAGNVCAAVRALVTMRLVSDAS